MCSSSTLFIITSIKVGTYEKVTVRTLVALFLTSYFCEHMKIEHLHPPNQCALLDIFISKQTPGTGQGKGMPLPLHDHLHNIVHQDYTAATKHCTFSLRPVAHKRIEKEHKIHYITAYLLPHLKV